MVNVDRMLRPRGLCDIRVELANVRVNRPCGFQIGYMRPGELVWVVFVHVYYGQC